MQWAVSRLHHCTLCHRTPRPHLAIMQLHLSTWGKKRSPPRSPRAWRFSLKSVNNYWFLTVGSGWVSIFTALLFFSFPQQRCERSIHEPSCWSSLRTSGRSGRGYVDLSQLQHGPCFLSYGCSPSAGSSAAAAAAGSVLSAASAVKAQLSSPETDTQLFPFPSRVLAVRCGLGILTQDLFSLSDPLN